MGFATVIDGNRWTKDTARQLLDKARTELLACLSGVTEQDIAVCLVTEEWTIRDVLIHIQVWEDVAVERLGFIRDGRAAEVCYLTPAEYDAWNERARRASAKWSTRDVLGRLEISHRHLLKLVETMTDEQLNEAPVLSRRWSHEREHTAQISRWRAALPEQVVEQSD